MNARPKFRLSPSAMFAAGVVALTALMSRKNSGETIIDRMRTPREIIVEAAESQLKLSDAMKYWRAAMPNPMLAISMASQDWCGAFVLWALKQAGIADHIFWIPGKGFELQNLTITKEPQPGDVAYFEKNQHRAIVVSANPDGTVTTVDGNSTNGQVTKHTRPKGAAHAYFSIEPLLMSRNA